MSTEVSNDDYIRWIKGAVNRVIGASLSDDSQISAEYRAWIVAFQINQSIPVHGKVDSLTQNRLILRGQVAQFYALWVRNALLILGDGLNVGGRPIAHIDSWGPDVQAALKIFQSKHYLAVDGFVGAKTETTLMKLTGTVPPGRKGGPKPAPTNPWNNLLSTTDKVEVFSRMFREELDHLSADYDPSRRAHLKCLMEKLKNPILETRYYRYYDARMVYNFVRTRIQDLLPQDPSGRPISNTKFDEVAELHAKGNAKEWMTKEIQKLGAQGTAALYSAFKKRALQLNNEIEEGLRNIQDKYEGHTYAQELQPAILHDWAMDRQKDPKHIYFCYK